MEKLTAPVHGYKIFGRDWTCRDKKYACPGEFKEAVNPIVCSVGMHFCQNLKDCFDYYKNDPENHCAEVVALGTVVQNGNKCATNHLLIVREIPWNEVLTAVNQGKNCTGIWNTGDCNTGDWNTGDCNTGNRNTGNRNTGNRNTGSWNSGDWNTGNWNTGNRNTGNWNSGNRNTGDWNSASFSNGVFCTEEPEILIFNKLSGMTLMQWRNSSACRLLNEIKILPNVWIYESDMTEEEKQKNPEYKTTGGFLKTLDTSDCCIRWWEQLSDDEKNIIRSIPNFDADIFKQITGIDA